MEKAKLYFLHNEKMILLKLSPLLILGEGVILVSMRKNTYNYNNLLKQLYIIISIIIVIYLL